MYTNSILSFIWKSHLKIEVNSFNQTFFLYIHINLAEEGLDQLILAIP